MLTFDNSQSLTRARKVHGRTQALEMFVADSIAMTIFFTIIGILNERFIAGMGWPEVLAARSIGAPPMVLTARGYGIWRDAIMKMSGALLRGGIYTALFDTLALLSFNIPIYASILYMGGASLDEVIKGSMGTVVILLVAGRPYGLWLDFVRQKFGVPTGQMWACDEKLTLA